MEQRRFGETVVNNNKINLTVRVRCREIKNCSPTKKTQRGEPPDARSIVSPGPYDDIARYLCGLAQLCVRTAQQPTAEMIGDVRCILALADRVLADCAAGS